MSSVDGTAADSLSPVQTAFYQRMIGDQALVALLATTGGSRPLLGVYDGAPEGAPHPYIDLGEAIETPRNAHGEFGAEVLETLHVWIKKRGYKDGLAIVTRLRVLFDHQPLDVEGAHVVSVRHVMTQTLRDPNPELRHLPVRFRITIEQE